MCPVFHISNAYRTYTQPYPWQQAILTSWPPMVALALILISLHLVLTLQLPLFAFLPLVFTSLLFMVCFVTSWYPILASVSGLSNLHKGIYLLTFISITNYLLTLLSTCITTTRSCTVLFFQPARYRASNI